MNQSKITIRKQYEIGLHQKLQLKLNLKNCEK